MAAPKLTNHAVTVGGITHVVQLDDTDAEQSNAKKLTGAENVALKAGKLVFDDKGAASIAKSEAPADTAPAGGAPAK